MVESQEEVATRSLVDSLAKQAALERLLEESKPPRQDDGTLHYLLATPFRYPPLKHGSRFGGRFEPSLFYAAMDRSSLLAESAYYRFVFRSGLEAPFERPLATSHTAFAVRISTECGVALDEPPFSAFQELFLSPTDYQSSQALGAALRSEGVQAIIYRSARDPKYGRNVGLYTPSALASQRPEQQVSWRCEVSDTLCLWREQGSHSVITIPVEQFLAGGSLPKPAL